MKHKIKGLIAWLLVLLQCFSLLPLTAFAATEKGTISSSFTYEKPTYTITVKDSYYDGDGNLEREEEREEKQYKEGEEYEYNALDPIPVGYMLNGDKTVSGVATEDTIIEFRYDKLTKAYVTFSYSEDLCNYLNETLGFSVDSTDIIARQQVRIGEKDNFNIHFDTLEEFCYVDGVYCPNISSFRSYYYDRYDGDWNSSAKYLGYPIEGLSEDYNVRIERNETDSNLPIQNCIDFDVTTNFSEYVGVDMETMSCCHIVLGMDGFNLVRTKDMLGVYRTVIDDMDASGDIESWYSAGGDLRFLSSFEDIKNYPDNFTLVEKGTRLKAWQTDNTVYYGRDKEWNKDVSYLKDGSSFEIGKAPLIKGYKCTNPDAPREFSCIYEYDDRGRDKYGYCFYYDYVPAVTYEITVKDKFTDESGAEIEVDGFSGVRLTDYIPENEPYSYEALGTTPVEGYKLVGDSVQTGVADSDKEIVFTYQKQPVITITVKDRFFDASGVEERTDIRQVDTYNYGEYYDYSELDSIPDGYSNIDYYYYYMIYGDEYEGDFYYGDAIEDKDIIFNYQKDPGCTITVRDKYMDRFGNEVKTVIREIENKYIGEQYEYAPVYSIDGVRYSIIDDGEYDAEELEYDRWVKKGYVTSDKEIVFTYQEIKEAYVTVYYSQAMCDFLNKRWHDDWVDSYEYFPDQEIAKVKVTLGRKYEPEYYGDEAYIEGAPLYLRLRKLGFTEYDNVSSFHTFYYTDGNWSSEYYLGYPIEGLTEDTNINIIRNDEYESIQYSTEFGIYSDFPSDLGIEPDTDVCCHIVLDIDGFNMIETRNVGIYRTVIEDIDSDADIEEWYKVKEEYRDEFIENYDEEMASYIFTKDMSFVNREPEKFDLIEDGTTIRKFLFTFGKDIITNEYRKPTVQKAPLIKGYKCINPDSPRSFECMPDWEGLEACYYYDYIPVITHDITVKDKFIDEDGNEEKTDIRQVDPVPEGEDYTYEAIDPIPDGYKLVSDPTIEGTSTEDEEIIFIYQKLAKYTVTVKDVFENGAGSEDNTLIRQEDEYYEGSSYSYSAITPTPEGYELIGVSDYAGIVSGDLEIIFTYRRKIEVVPNTYSMVVKDKYIDIDGSVIKIDERINTELKEFAEYTFTAINPVPEGYEIVGASGYFGKITEDMEIIFVYQKKTPEKPVNHTFKIVDEYCDEDGNVIKTVERVVEELPEGSEYHYKALDPVPDGYVLVSDSEISGVVTEDMVITFRYQNEKSRFITVKGYLTYKNGEPVANKKVEVHSTVRSTVTDANGYYEINNVEVGSHKFTVFNEDGTDLITCDIEVTKDGQDTASVTYKMTDVEVVIDMSVADVLEIDGVLPIYKLEVIDQYYNESNALIKSELRESLSAVKAGTAYSYDALRVEGYSVVSAKNYSGVITKDTTLIFMYRKDKTPDKPKPDPKPEPSPSPNPEPEKKYFTITVIDNYYDANAQLINSQIRLTETKEEGSAYYYEAKLVPNFTLIGADHFSDYVYSNITIAFAYKVIAPLKKSEITVIDRFIDEDGNPDDKVRVTEEKNQGDPYEYESIPVDGYEVEGNSSYSGVVTDDLVLIFTYKKNIEKAKEYTITIIDKFITDIPMSNFVIDKNSKSDASDGLNTFDTYSYAKEGNQYIYMVRRELRCKGTFTEGSTYIYNALDLKNYNCISDSVYAGTVKGDLEIEFVYARNGLKRSDIPDDVYKSRPDYPDMPEATTGNLDDIEGNNKLPIIFVVILFAGVGVAAAIGRRRFYK